MEELKKLEKETVFRCDLKGHLCAEIVYLKCILFKLKNATKSFRFYRALKYFVDLTSENIQTVEIKPF